jgi:hypothetical protein
VLCEADWASGRATRGGECDYCTLLDAAILAGFVLLSNGGHFDELKETLGAGLPVILAAVGLSILLIVLAALPPSTLPEGVVSDLLAARRRQVAAAGVAISLSAAIVFAIVFWVL